MIIVREEEHSLGIVVDNYFLMEVKVFDMADKCCCKAVDTLEADDFGTYLAGVAAVVGNMAVEAEEFVQDREPSSREVEPYLPSFHHRTTPGPTLHCPKRKICDFFS
jgi:hypothetical protein